MADRDPYWFVPRAQATSARLNNGARGWSGSAINSGDQSLGTVSQTTYSITSASHTSNVGANRLMLILGYASLTVASGTVVVSLDILDGATNLGRAEIKTIASTTASLSGWVTSTVSTAAAKTYSLQLTVLSIATGTPTISVSGTNPSQAKIIPIDMGASS